jgi:hypothetical protein
MLATCQNRLLLLGIVVARVLDGQQAAAAQALAAAGSALLPIAPALAAAPAARWWWEPVNRGGQRWIGAEGSAPARVAAIAAGIRQSTAAEQEEEQDLARRSGGRSRHRSPKLPASGTWWSAPLGGTVSTTAGPVDVLPAVELGCASDGAGEEMAEIWAVEIDDGARAGDRQRRRLGSASRRVSPGCHGLTPGRLGRLNRSVCPWVLPDWPAVARDWDGIHLSVGGHLTASGRALAAGRATTILAVWEPDQAFWLNEVFTWVEHLASWRGGTGSEAMPDVVPPMAGVAAVAAQLPCPQKPGGRQW